MAVPKKKKKGEDAVDENPVFEVPADEKVFKGDPNDRKALLRHKQRVKASAALVFPCLDFVAASSSALTVLHL